MADFGMEQEVELAFLAKSMPSGVYEVNGKEVTDVYLSPEDDLLTKIRLRHKGDTYELTKKVVNDESDLSQQTEYNMPLTGREYELFKTLGGRAVEKVRYNITIDGHSAEVDVFKGLLSGLVLIEFEFPSTTERDSFRAPDICLAEVTQEDFIAGAYLAGKTYEAITPELNRFGYVPLYADSNA